MENVRIVYMGTPEFSVLPLKRIIENYNVVGVVTQPDKEVGRKKEIVFSKVKEVALENNIKILQPKNIKEEYEEIIKLEPDLIITCAYGQIIPKELLDYPRLGCVNIHASVLPKHRGGAPIHRALINGDDVTGITIMYMSERMDAGDIIFQEEINILDEDNVGTLFERLSRLGSKMILNVLPNIINRTVIRIRQDERKATYSYNITREEEKIDFNKSTVDVFNHIRGLNPWPVGYALFDNKKMKIYESKKGESKKDGKPGEIINIYDDSIGVKTNDGEILLTVIQLEGKKKVNVKDYLNGVQNKEELIGKQIL